MTLKALSRRDFASRLGLAPDGTEDNWPAIADLLRAPLARWGLSPRDAVVGYARRQLQIAELEDTSVVSKVLDQMFSLGECEQVYLDGDKYLAPADPRWIPIGDGLGAYLGVSGPPSDLVVERTGHSRSIVQRVRVDTEEERAQLEVAGIRETSIREWLSPLGYLAHAARRLGRPVPSDSVSLTQYWAILEAALVDEGLTAGSGAELRVLNGEPGAFFGRQDAKEPEGRWVQEVDEGVWCGFRRGYGDAHWHPIVISAHDGKYRLLDLHDRDEWRWALLARAYSIGPREVVDGTPGSFKLTFPVPSQLHTMLDIVGTRSGTWAWELPSGAPGFWHLVEQSA